LKRGASRSRLGSTTTSAPRTDQGRGRDRALGPRPQIEVFGTDLCTPDGHLRRRGAHPRAAWERKLAEVRAGAATTDQR